MNVPSWAVPTLKCLFSTNRLNALEQNPSCWKNTYWGTVDVRRLCFPPREIDKK